MVSLRVYRGHGVYGNGGFSGFPLIWEMYGGIGKR